MQWECHIEIPDDDKGTAYEMMFGVATKKDRKFYDALAEQEEGRLAHSHFWGVACGRDPLLLNENMFPFPLLTNVHRKSGFEWYRFDAKNPRQTWFRGGCCRPTVGFANGPIPD